MKMSIVSVNIYNALTLCIVMYSAHFMNAMEDIRLTKIKEAIGSQKICTFFASLENIDSAWLIQNKQAILNAIASAELRTLGIEPRYAHQTKITDNQKKFIKPFKVMRDGIDCLENDISQMKLQTELDALFSQ